MSNGDMPAMAIKVSEYDENGRIYDVDYHSGLTKREHFAGLAMQGLIETTCRNGHDWDMQADTAVEMANALLKALDAD